ncbi:MAG: NAD-dependent epimerase/dehydratase family protein [Chitinispirillaceae bacterium]|nr:NAD-dependent epimerase/dehydratase family protein [Chitinispirillaceae bacterium]
MKKPVLTKNDSITIIGCGGFIGSHLVDRLLAATPCRITGIDLVSDKIAGHLANDRLTFKKIDVHDVGSLRPYIGQGGTVVHLAALCNPALYTTRTLDVIDINCIGTVPVVRMCAEAGARLVYFSTSEVYGRTAASLAGSRGNAKACVLREDDSPFILGPVRAQRWSYACAKQLAERLIAAYGRERGLDYTIVRPFNFIGPRMDFIPGVDGEGVPRVPACFLSALLEGRPLRLVDGGRNRRCFTYIGDAIDACMKILEKPRESANQIFNIGNPANETTIAGLARIMIRLWRKHVPGAGRAVVKKVSAAEFYGPGYEDCDRRMPDIRKARTLLGWEPSTGLEAALDMTIRAAVSRYRPRARKA